MNRLLAVALCTLSLLTGGCLVMKHHPSNAGASPDSAPSLAPLSDQDAKTQLTDLARQIVATAGLQDVDAGFMFSSCNDQGDPPYQGSLEMGFGIPPGQQPDTYINQVVARMRTVGWADGPPPGQTYAGRVLNREGIAAQIRRPTPYDAKGAIQIHGHCRNMSDHHDDGRAQDVTADIA